MMVDPPGAPAVMNSLPFLVAINGVLGRETRTQWAEPPKRDKPSPNKPSRAHKKALLSARVRSE